MSESLKPGTQLAGRYHILARIGEGGFGTVYKARDRRKYGKRVAIKEINMAALSAREKIEVTDTFNREITLLSTLRYKGLPRIYDQFTDPEHWYIVMEYIEGQTLEDLLVRAPMKRLSVKQTARIGIALCDVLFYLHNQHPPIVFRDVKPGNIMLTFWDRLYLIDFGIARRYREGQARDTGPLGSPGYAAPEQYGRTQTTVQTDIYGLGVTLQTLLSGKEPLELRQEGMPPDVQLPQKLQALLGQMTDPDPARRPRGMSEIKRALIPYATNSWVHRWVLCQASFWVLVQSGFLLSPLLGPYFLLMLVCIVVFCITAVLRIRRRASARLSVKATIMVMAKRLLSSVLPALVLTGGVALVYALPAGPPQSRVYLVMWILYVALFVLELAIYVRRWLKRRQKMAQPNQGQTSPQELLVQQQIRRRP